MMKTVLINVVILEALALSPSYQHWLHRPLSPWVFPISGSSHLGLLLTTLCLTLHLTLHLALHLCLHWVTQCLALCTSSASAKFLAASTCQIWYCQRAKKCWKSDEFLNFISMSDNLRIGAVRIEENPSMPFEVYAMKHMSVYNRLNEATKICSSIFFFIFPFN